MGVRDVFFLIGCFLMALSLVARALPGIAEPPDRPWRGWLFDLGLLLAVAAHGWPDAL